MQYAQLGRSGLIVSRLILGCMSFGDASRGRPGWALDEQNSREMIRSALEAGVTAFDTANSYSLGSSEEYVGRALRDFADRDDVVIATKGWGRMRPGPYGVGLSRKSLLAEIDASLRRLGTDFIDLYQIHRLDRRIPMPEILQALDDAVRAGKIRYIGASSMAAWEFASLLGWSELRQWSAFVSMQDRYSLLYREEEREMHPLCLDRGIGVIPWSPLARGLLARDGAVSSTIAPDDSWAKRYYDESDARVIEAVRGVAAARGVARATVALAWVLQKPAVTAPIIGVTKPHHLSDALAALDLELSVEETQQLEEGYMPRPVSGF